MMLTVALVLALVPGLLWLFFYLSEDNNVEPKSLVALTFFSGIAFAFFALIIQRVLEQVGFIGRPTELGQAGGNFTFFVVTLLVLAGVEEICKFVAAYVVVHKSPDFNQPIDAMLYVVIAALGFATVENIGIAAPLGLRSLGVAIIIESLALRFIGATLLHTLSSGILGYYWAIDIRRFNSKIWLIFGIILATILHAVFNYLIIKHANLFYSLAFVVFLGFFTLSDFEKLKERAV